MINVTLPELKEGIEESLVVLWFVSEGDKVQKGDPLAEVQTEKATAEIEAEADGVIREIAVKRGESAKVGDVLAVIDPDGTASAQEAKPENVEPVKQRMPEEGETPPVTPRLKRLAKELGVTLASVKGTGRGGRITEEDIRTLKEEKIPLTGTRGVIAQRLVESLRGSAQFTITAWADVTELKTRKSGIEGNPGWTALIAAACTRVLPNHPLLRARVENEKIIIKQGIHLGFAIETETGLHTGVIPEASGRSPKELHERLRELAEKARKSGLSEKESAGSTFTITSLGAHRVQFFTPIINPPETSILGIGKIEPWVIMDKEKPVERFRLPLSLTVDHRAVDGSPAAAFLDELIDILEHPQSFLTERER
ncbi:dihydrolipoamide acetyltransferase family protein [Alkalicoccus halolimnae]|uniref:Dihydrolipoamide acetyltransferase component of pyruvate dehydrogenase complex n=1 Tax=Alkalicoccus halolimnae TaxID=1667239 RepID=A0A5C7F9N2_9BACI|nr:dihydrolipoamide acetyltransferase family protein [Alkalicoccus halolimnae]TXF86773.1 2-oxo acid dehydrogenase subunit E2 [Alkalicoccus halolimnae]